MHSCCLSPTPAPHVHACPGRIPRYSQPKQAPVNRTGVQSTKPQRQSTETLCFSPVNLVYASRNCPACLLPLCCHHAALAPPP
ncbi:hypothetical protein U1Q18_005004 [Sarracenia purpurea var. burkii]